MSRDEEEFGRVLEISGRFSIVETKVIISHHKLPEPHYLEVDNIAQRGRTLFIFEGNARKETEAIKQLKDRCISLKLYGNKYKKRKIFDEFTNIRIFWYSMKKKTIVEYTDKGEKVSTQKFDDIKMLISKIQKI